MNRFVWTDKKPIYKGGHKVVKKVAYEVERAAKQNVTQMIQGYEPKHPRPPGSPTGNLRRSITTVMETSPTGPKATAVVGTNVEYAPYFEFGANGVPPRPFLANALREGKRRYGL